jgi:hypothetical protein
MPEQPLCVHICSRDRPVSLSLLLDDLAALLRRMAVRVTVYDDSTTQRNREENAAVIEEATLPAAYFGERERILLAERAAAIDPAVFEMVARPLGRREWDLAGVRQVAFLNAALNGIGDESQLFLDDDLRLADCTYAGLEFRVDHEEVRRELSAKLGTGGLWAAGASYRGRADLSMLEHLEAILDREGLETGDRCPAVITPELSMHPDSPGLSGGFLVTNPATLRAISLCPTYNEDWIWLRQLALSGGVLEPFGFSVVHAGEVSFALSETTLVMQFRGEVLDAAVRLCQQRMLPMESAVSLVDEAHHTCLERLDKVVRRAERSPDLGQASRILAAAEAQVRSLKMDWFRQELATHLERSERCAQALEAASNYSGKRTV